MGISVKLGVGAALVAIGLSGLAYTVPRISDETDPEDPAHPRSLMWYAAMEMVSAAVLTGGIALCAIAQGEALAGSGLPSRTGARGGADAKDAKKTEAA